VTVFVNQEKQADIDQAFRNHGQLVLCVFPSSGEVSFRKIEVKRLPSAKSAAPLTPFALLARGGKAERLFATLEAAVAAARPGAAIEIRGDGPFDVAGIRLQGKPLLIRAGLWAHPVLRHAAADAAGFLLDSDAALVLEGLVLEGTTGNPTGKEPRGLLKVHNAPLYLAHCRCLVKGERLNVYARGAPECEVRHCLLLGDRWHPLGWPLPTDGVGRLTVQNSVLAGNAGGLSLHWYASLADVRDVAVALTRTTIVATWPLEIRLERAGVTVPAQGAGPPMRLTLSENLIQGTDAVMLFNQALNTPLPARQAEEWLRGTVRVQERKNGYASVGVMLRFAYRF
jgi:hypothetical protein